MLLIPAGAGPVPSLDSVGPSNNVGLPTGAGTCTSTHPASPTGSTRTILSFLGVQRISNISNDYTMTCGGSAMTLLATASLGSDGSYFNFLMLYGKLAQTSAAKAIVGGSTGSEEMYLNVNSVAYQNVSAFGTAATNGTTSGTSLTLNVSSAIGQMVMADFYSPSGGAITGVTVNNRTVWATAFHDVMNGNTIADAPGAGRASFTGTIAGGAQLLGAAGINLIA